MRSDRRHCVRNKLLNMHSMPIGFMLMLLMLVCEINGAVTFNRNASPDANLENAENSVDKPNVNYDEYPMVVPKRTVALLDRLMRVLTDTLDEVEHEVDQRNNLDATYRDEHSANKRMRGPIDNTSHNSENNEIFEDLISGIERRANRRTDYKRKSTRDDSLELKRGGHGEALGSNKGRVYWRCYFNAVTCF